MPFRPSPLLRDALAPRPPVPRSPAGPLPTDPAHETRAEWVHALARHEARAARRNGERWLVRRDGSVPWWPLGRRD